MDYKLQWKIEKKIGVPFIPSSGVQLTPYPAIDYVNPGCEGKLYNFYVPLHSKSSIHLINKKIDDVGLIRQEHLSKPEDTQIGLGTVEESDSTEDPVKYNDIKKAKLGEVIQANFLHPKPVVTGIFDPQNKTTKSKADTKIKTSSSKKDFKGKIKHSFHII